MRHQKSTLESSDSDLVADASPQNLLTHWWADALPQCSTLSAPSLSHSRSAFAERFGLRYQWDDPLLDGYPPYPFISFHMIFWVSFLGSWTEKEIKHLNIVVLSQTGIGPQETSALLGIPVKNQPPFRWSKSDCRVRRLLLPRFVWQAIRRLVPPAASPLDLRDVDLRTELLQSLHGAFGCRWMPGNRKAWPVMIRKLYNDDEEKRYVDDSCLTSAVLWLGIVDGWRFMIMMMVMMMMMMMKNIMEKTSICWVALNLLDNLWHATYCWHFCCNIFHVSDRFISSPTGGDVKKNDDDIRSGHSFRCVFSGLYTPGKNVPKSFQPSNHAQYSHVLSKCA